MAEAVIVPPTPTITQGESIDSSPGIEAVQRAFDTAYPMVKTSASPPEPAKSKETPKPDVQPKSAPPAEPDKGKETVSKDATDESTTQKLPSFLDDALKVEPDKSVAQDEFPEVPPADETPDQRKNRWKGLRDAYEKVKTELKNRPAQQDEATALKLQTLEKENSEQKAILQRLGIEQHTEFQQKIIQPMSAAWNEAARIVKDAGGDPQDLAKALGLRGKAQFEALDQIFEGMPESAKAEVHQHISQWRRLNDQRIKALQDAPKTFEELRKKDVQRQSEMLENQRKEMRTSFDEAVRILREDANLALLQKSDDPEAQWWNEQADTIIKRAEDLAFKNTDMKKAMLTTVLASAFDPVYKMWMAERQAHAKTKKLLNGKLESEPSLSESSGGVNGKTTEEDLKRPFSQVFLEKLHEIQRR